MHRHDLRTVMSDSLLRMVGSVPTRLRLRGAAVGSLPGSSSSEDASVDSSSTPSIVLHQHGHRQPLSRARDGQASRVGAPMPVAH